jgi:hypothetical protein
MDIKTVDVADLDCIYLSYDEPQKEEFWISIRNHIPWAERVDGVKGSDAAHKAAADASNTDRFILIDGDNLPDWDFFNQTLRFDSLESERAVFRWRAKNHINGLTYGNGGLSSWTKEFVYNMRTHENSLGNDETDVEFCFDPLYWAMHDCYSTTYPNGSAFHAWRAGFREGVKMCLNRGRKPNVVEFKDAVHKRNMDNLSIWHNVGRDVEYGEQAILGSRYGTWLTMLNDWDYTQVQSFDSLETIYSEYQSVDMQQVSNALSVQLDLPVIDIADSTVSKFFKHHYQSNWTNLDIMKKEIDVIRKAEGW